MGNTHTSGKGVYLDRDSVPSPNIASGILPVNTHAVINILNLNYINSFIQYSSMTKLRSSVA